MLLTDSSPWQAAAACAGLSPSIVFARRAQHAAPALRACAVCPVRRECEAAVAPAESYFDGVCAGRLWRNGRPADAARVARAVATTPTAPRAAPRGAAHGVTWGADSGGQRAAASAVAPDAGHGAHGVRPVVASGRKPGAAQGAHAGAPVGTSGGSGRRG
ncbi:WhiB family transcriptional regulator [Streptomyces sp. NPDC093600]|uniref:WhiB family transcriptional regulator n=1 Tax=Streptomyces sp. NPDC093600 TaxID=3366047 RepID=UPI0038095578